MKPHVDQGVGHAIAECLSKGQTGIHAAVSPRPLTGTHPGRPSEQRMMREAAVRSFTIWKAYGSCRG